MSLCIHPKGYKEMPEYLNIFLLLHETFFMSFLLDMCFDCKQPLLESKLKMPSVFSHLKVLTVHSLDCAKAAFNTHLADVLPPNLHYPLSQHSYAGCEGR